MVRSLFLAGNAAVIVDATNYHAKRRSKWESIAAEMGAAIKLQIFGTSKSVCIQRAYATNQPHLAEVIERMAEEWDIEGVDVNC
jgi:predicted kinase